MASDGCRSQDDMPICDPSNQTMVLLLPTAAATGVLLIAIGGGIAVRHRRTTIPWQIAAWLLLLTAGIVACAILTGGRD